MLSFVPRDKFTLDKHVVHHVFCKTCGIKSFAYGKVPSGEMVAINLRCLDDVEIFATVAAARQVDGKSR